MSGGGAVAAESVPYVLAARSIMLGFVVLFLLLIRQARRRNGHRVDGFGPTRGGAW